MVTDTFHFTFVPQIGHIDLLEVGLTDMSDSEPPKFASIEDERDYWKEQAVQHQQRYWHDRFISLKITSVFTVHGRPVIWLVEYFEYVFLMILFWF